MGKDTQATKQYYLRGILPCTDQDPVYDPPIIKDARTEKIIEDYLKYIDTIKVMISRSLVLRWLDCQLETLDNNERLQPELKKRLAHRFGYNSWKHMSRFKGTMAEMNTLRRALLQRLPQEVNP